MRCSGEDFVQIRRVLDGDIQSFNVLVQKYQYRVQNVVTPFSNDTTEILDITQEAFLRVYRNLHKFHFNSTFYTWLYRIAVNTAYTYLEKEKRHRHHKDLTCDNYLEDIPECVVHHPIANTDNPESLLVAEESLDQIYRTVMRMPVNMRSAYLLREFEGLSYDEVADMLKCPLGTVRSRIYRARGMMEAKHQGLKKS